MKKTLIVFAFIFVLTSTQILSSNIQNCLQSTQGFCIQCKPGFIFNEGKTRCIQEFNSTNPSCNEEKQACPLQALTQDDYLKLKGLNTLETLSMQTLQNLNTLETLSIQTVQNSFSASLYPSPSFEQASDQNDVAEPELMRTDGKYIYTFTNNTFSIFQAYPVSNARLMSGLKFNIAIQNMFLFQDKVLLYGYTYKNYQVFTTTIFIINVEDKYNPLYFNQIVMSGKYFDARLTKQGYVYFLTKSVQRLDLSYIQINGNTKNYLKRDQIYIIPKSDILIDKDAVMISIAAFYVNNPTNIGLKGIITKNVKSLYMTDKAIYLFYDIQSSSSASSVIRKISVNGLSIKQTASRSLQGNINNRFSLDEHYGELRVGTYDTFSNKNYLIILSDNLLSLKHSLPFGFGHRISAMRFTDRTVYISTVNGNDPLYVIDVDPFNAPKYRGQVNTQSYSRFIYLFEQDIIVTFGRLQLSNGAQYGLKVSLLDITNPSNPMIVAESDLENSDYFSNAEFDNKAILLSNQKNVLVVPLQIRSQIDSQGDVSAAILYYIDRARLINKKLIKHQPKITAYPLINYNIQRSLIIEEVLYTKSRCLLKINDIFNGDQLKSLAVPPCN